VQRIDNIIDHAQLPTRAPANMDYATFMKYMSVDKKVEAGVIRLVLLQAIGKAIITSDYDLSLLSETIHAHHAI
jgi:3-dehydroquinate synthase